MISIVIPVYNVSKYLEDSLHTVYSQKGVQIEVVLVNDGSTDNSLSICEEYHRRFKGITKVIDKTNGGLSDARNAGIEVASGEWIYFFDSDDRLVSGALRKLYNYAVSERCEMVAGGFFYDYGKYLLYDDRWLKDDTPFVLSRDEAMVALIKQQYLKNFAWGKLYKTEIVKNHPFRKGAYYEDSFWQHLIIHDCERIGIIPEPLYYYRQRESSISGGFSDRNLDLLRGNEERLHFIMDNYPELKYEMASSLWRMSHSFKGYAELSGKEELVRLYSSFYSDVEERYKELFNASLSGDIDYKFRDMKTLSYLYNLPRRVWNHFFGKILKRIEVDEGLPAS